MHLRPILAIALGSILLTTTGLALADRDDRRGYRGGFKDGYHHDRGWRQSGRHYSSHKYSGRKWRSERRHGWRHNRGDRVRIYHNYRHRPDYTGIIGGVLIGSAITHSLHDAYNDRQSYRAPGRVSGCYRIEHLGGGRERRVELPLSWCR